jgi:3-oxoacyl-[acyl-carrier protein] reductase
VTLDLSGKVALVTGASRGIGRAIARTLATAGAQVVITSRGDAAQAVADEITQAGGQALALAADVSDAAAIAGVVDRILDAYGRLDVLVNNAGITRDQLLLRMKRDDWDAVIATNLTGTFVCTQAVLKTMVRQRAGRIISISSVVGQSGNPGQTNYAATKAGIIGFSKALAREVASRNITVNVVAPGLIDTDMTREISSDAQASWTSNIPLGRLGTPDDVAAAVCFLASDAASYITGQVLAVNGGMYA